MQFAEMDVSKRRATRLSPVASSVFAFVSKVLCHFASSACPELGGGLLASLSDWPSWSRPETPVEVLASGAAPPSLLLLLLGYTSVPGDRDGPSSHRIGAFRQGAAAVG